MTEAPTDKRVDAALDAARRAVPSWTAGRQQEIKWATAARLEEVERTRARAGVILGRAALALGMALVAVGALAGWRGLAGAPLRWTAFTTARGPATAAPEPAAARLADGTSIVLDGPTAILKKTIETADEVGFQLEGGGAHFEVARRPSRVFRVHAGPVTVQVIGTRFHVQREAGGGAHVGVDRGRVLVSWWGGARELGPGESGSFPPVGPPAAPLPSQAAPAPTVASVAPRNMAASARPEALFARADRARATGNPEAALAPLRELIRNYPRDPLAPAAAFTAGRLLLEALGRPREAALSFAQARALAKNGPLGDDALAREVEAWSAAGDGAAARQRADLYRRLYPTGPRLSTVLRFGGSKAVP